MAFKVHLHKYLILDGYNVLNALEAFKSVMLLSLEDARAALNEVLKEYAAISGEYVVVVYDAYKGKLKTTKVEKEGRLEIVFTKEHETADSYIEGLAEDLNQNKRNMVRVVTSDWAEQQIVLGSGASRLVPKEFYQEYEKLMRNLRKEYEHKPAFATLEGRIDPDVLRTLEAWRRR